MLSIGTTGDVMPMIRLGEELKRRGHTVQIAAYEPLCTLIGQAGLEYYCLPGDAYRYISELIRPGKSPVTFLNRLNRAVREEIRPLMQALIDAAKGADALVLTYFGSIGYSIAEKLNIPCFQLHYYPMDQNNEVPLAIMPPIRLGQAYNRLTYQLAYLAVGGLEHHYLHRWRKLNGMRARRIRTRPDYTVGKWKIPVLYAISQQILPRSIIWPPNIHMVGFLQSIQPEPYIPSPALKAFLEKGPAPIYIGFGSMTTGDMGEMLNIVLASLRKAGLRAVMLKGWGEMPDRCLPSYVYMADFIPHSWLFEQVCAVVHHGGAGTTAAGLYAGKPTLVIPFGGDQPFWASRIYRRGLGPKPITRSRVTEEKLTITLKRLVENPCYAENARYIRDHLRMENGAVNAANVILEKAATFPKV